MKAGKWHRVPLTACMMSIPDELPRLKGNALIFPARRGKSASCKPLSAFMRRMQETAEAAGRTGWHDPRIGRPAVAHGLGSSFREWVATRTWYERDMTEIALSHTVGSEAEQAYRRGETLQTRRKMMADWSASGIFRPSYQLDSNAFRCDQSRAWKGVVSDRFATRSPQPRTQSGQHHSAQVKLAPATGSSAGITDRAAEPDVPQPVSAGPDPEQSQLLTSNEPQRRSIDLQSLNIWPQRSVPDRPTRCRGATPRASDPEVPASCRAPTFPAAAGHSHGRTAPAAILGRPVTSPITSGVVQPSKSEPKPR